MTPTTKETCQTRAYGRLGKGDKSHAAHARRTRAHARRIVPTPAALGGPKRTSSPRPLAPVCCSFAAAFSVHTIILLTQEPLADWKALLPPSLAAPKRHAHTVDAREQALDSLPARRPEDCDPVRSPPDGPSSATLAVLLAVRARRAVKAEESDPCKQRDPAALPQCGLVSTIFSHLACTVSLANQLPIEGHESRQCCRLSAQWTAEDIELLNACVWRSDGVVL